MHQVANSPVACYFPDRSWRGRPYRPPTCAPYSPARGCRH